MVRILRSTESQNDAVEIWAYIARNNPQAADRLLDKFDEVFTALSLQPQMGKSVEELSSRLRFIPIGNYLVFYRPLPDGVEIARILHGARDITQDFFE